VGRLRLEVKETRGGRDLRDLMYDSGKVLRWEGGRSEGIIKPETLGRTGEGKIFNVFRNYHLPDVTIIKLIDL
jgi:hypothetical protein